MLLKIVRGIVRKLKFKQNKNEKEVSFKCQATGFEFYRSLRFLGSFPRVGEDDL